MGAKFTKALVDGTLVCDPRGGWCAKMGLQDSAETQGWHELIIGAFVSLTGISDDNQAWSAETIASTGAFDRFLFGIKDDDDSLMINVAGTYYMGISSKLTEPTAIATTGALTLRGGGFGRHYFATSNDTTVNTTSDIANEIQFGSTTDAVADTNYARFHALRAVRTNVGTATEAVTMYFVGTGATKYTDTSLANLRTLINGFTGLSPTTSGSMTFNTGAAAYPTPDTWYVRWPFLNSRLRIHSAMYQVNTL